MPEAAAQTNFDWTTTLYGAAVMGAVIVGVLALHQAVKFIVMRIGRRLDSAAIKSLARRSSAAGRVLLVVLVVQLMLPALVLPTGVASITAHVVSILVIVAITWLLIRLTFVADDVIADRYPMDVPDNRRARRLTTVARIMRQIVSVVLVIIGAAVVLMTFPAARELGASMLASAGIAGIVVGMAARPALSNIIAGVQIALTEPIALDDVVIVEGEFGWVEEITTTYVVIRIWDLRRLVVPLGYFIEKPFQNWTRTTADLLGSVFVHVDFTVPVEAVRAELTRLLEADKRWDRKVNVVHVTEAKDGRLELRLLMSAGNAPTLWDLRCAVREKIVEFLAREYPGALQRARVELSGDFPPTRSHDGHAPDRERDQPRDGRRGNAAS